MKLLFQRKHPVGFSFIGALLTIVILAILLNAYLNTNKEVDKVRTNQIKEKTIAFWDTVWTDQSYISTINELINQYKVIKPDIKISYELKPLKYYNQIMATSIASRTQPDMCTLLGTQAIMLANNNFILPADSVITVCHGGSHTDNFVEVTVP